MFNKNLERCATNDDYAYERADARDALLEALVGEDPDAGAIRTFDLPGDDPRGAWVLAEDDFNGGPGFTLTAPNGERFIAIIEREDVI